MGDIVLAGATSGTTTLTPTAVSGTTTLTLPATTGTLVLAAAPTFTGQATIPTINLTGGQIAFPASQSASTDANTLDDYEEGTWTPNQGGGLTVIGTFSSSGTYVKIGKQVTVLGMLSATTSIAYNGNAIMLSTLPFAAVVNSTVGGAVNNANTAGTFINPSTNTVYASGAMSATANIPFFATYITSA